MTQCIDAIGCYGTVYHLGPTLHPHRDLLRECHRKHAEKIFIDKKDGSTVHIGYLVGGEWFILYVVTPWEGKL